MASIFDLNSDSSDSENDVDYVPPNAAESDPSEDEGSDDDTEICEEPASKKIKLNEQERSIKSEPAVNRSADEVWKSFLGGVQPANGKANGQQNVPSTSNEVLSETASELESAKNDLDGKKVPDGPDSVPKSDEIFPKKNLLGTDSINIVPDPHTDDANKDVKDVLKKEKPVDVLINRPRTGLSSVLGTIANKGKKQSVLETSLADWKSFKEEQGIAKDLETFNKGRSGYIERQRFLQRSDVRSFENEKNVRLSGKKK